MTTPIYNYNWKGMALPWGPRQLKPDFDLKIQPKWDFIEVSMQATSPL